MFKGAIQEKRFEYKGFPCVVVMQALCFRTGYVGIPKGHPLYEKDYWEISVNCHGGLTYSENRLIDQPDKDTWWIGFDSGHYGDGYDLTAALELFKDFPETLEQINKMNDIGGLDTSFPAASLEYIEEQCKSIVDQIKEVMPHDSSNQ